MFQYGHDAHARWQRWLAETRLLEGSWTCDRCGFQYYAHSRALSCPACRSNRATYRELRLGSDDLLIEGYTDGYVPDRKALIEIKTIGEGTVRMYDPALLARHRLETSRGEITDVNGLWNDIHRPFTPHLKQGQIYLHLARAMGLDVERIAFFYDSKLNQDSKEFAVSYDVALIQPILDGAAAVKAYIVDGGPLPKCRAPYQCKQCGET